jgi:pseudaminic acid synthase
MKILRQILARELVHPYIIAEISANHGGDITNAKKLIDSAKNSGANSVKLQTFTADRITVNSDAQEFAIPSSSALWGGKNLWELMKEAETPLEWHQELFKHAESLGLEVFSTAYDIEAVKFLLDSGVECIKVSSFDLINIPLLEYLASCNVPVIFSTGMGSASEIDTAAMIFSHRKDSVGILQCTSSYPCAPSDVNMNRHRRLIEYGFVTGYSDHTLDSVAAILAIGNGALVFEKHISLAGSESLDSKFSMDELQFKDYVEKVRQAFESMGNSVFEPTHSEGASVWERPSVIALTDIHAGEEFTVLNIGIRRPAIGANPEFYHKILGMSASELIRKGEGVPWNVSM